MRLRYAISFAVLTLAACGLAGCGASEFQEDEGTTESQLNDGVASVPNFESMWNNYPHGEAEEAKATIGGAVDADWITNTCTIRLSRALNYAGDAVPVGPKQSAKGLHTVKGADGMNYAYRVAEMRQYLLKRYGKPTIDRSSSGSSGVDKAPFTGKKGIIVFDVRGWSDATGHADLWNGSQPGHGEYFAQASNVMLWEAPSNVTTPITEPANETEPNAPTDADAGAPTTEPAPGESESEADNTPPDP